MRKVNLPGMKSLKKKKKKNKKSWGKDGESIKNQRKKNNGGDSDTKEGKY